jgi:alpha-ketoglutarate-dependent taurine dioxygenase
MLELHPITDTIGTEVRGVDLSEELTSQDFERIYEAWIQTTILLFRGQRLDPQDQIDFTSRFGEMVGYTRSKFNHPEFPEILVLSNLLEGGKQIGSPRSGRVWHTDGHYLEHPPAGSILYALQVPPTGGDTWFANMAAAYDALPESVKARVEDLEVVISRVQSRPYNYPDRPPPSAEEQEAWVEVAHPLIRLHEMSGRKAIYAGGNVPWRISGMPEKESMPLLTFIQEFSIQPRFTYRHRWEAGDIIVWDNRSAMHKATQYDQEAHRRLMHRTTFDGPPGGPKGPSGRALAPREVSGGGAL